MDAFWPIRTIAQQQQLLFDRWKCGFHASTLFHAFNQEFNRTWCHSSLGKIGGMRARAPSKLFVCLSSWEIQQTHSDHAQVWLVARQNISNYNHAYNLTEKNEHRKKTNNKTMHTRIQFPWDITREKTSSWWITIKRWHSPCDLLLLPLLWLYALGFPLIFTKFRVQPSHLRAILTAVPCAFAVQLSHMATIFSSLSFY